MPALPMWQRLRRAFVHSTRRRGRSATCDPLRWSRSSQTVRWIRCVLRALEFAQRRSSVPKTQIALGSTGQRRAERCICRSRSSDESPARFERAIRRGERPARNASREASPAGSSVVRSTSEAPPRNEMERRRRAARHEIPEPRRQDHHLRVIRSLAQSTRLRSRNHEVQSA